MKEAVAGELAAAYDSALVDEVRAGGFRYTSGGSRSTWLVSSASATASIARLTTPTRPVGASLAGMSS